MKNKDQGNVERGNVQRGDVEHDVEHDVERGDVDQGARSVSYGPAYLSPSSIACYEESNSEFFLRYMVHVPRSPQSKAMAAGSAFDACVKAYIERDSFDPLRVESCNLKLQGRRVKYGTPYTSVVLDTSLSPHMQLYECLLAESVERQNISWARDIGKSIFVDYRSIGALDNILDDASSIRCVDELLCDFGPVPVPLLGKPDLVYRSRKTQELVVDDWKVNGYVAARSVSPTAGYVDMFPSRAVHNDCILESGGGLAINTCTIPSVYYLQLVAYAMLVDCSVVGISQLVFDKDTQLRVAKHRYRVTAADKASVLSRATVVWSAIKDWRPGMGFGDVSAKRCTQLMGGARVLSDPLVAMLSGRGLG